VDQGDDGKKIYVPEETFNISKDINMAEQDLKMDETKTVVTTIVSLGPPNHDPNLLTEKMLLMSEQMQMLDLENFNELRSNFNSQKDLICLGKLVPNIIRDQDNLFLELMLPADLDVEENMKEAANLLAPFLIVSNNMVFNFDEMDLKTALTQSVNMLMKVTDVVNFEALKQEDHDDLEHQVANIMPQIYFVTSYSVQDLKD